MKCKICGNDKNNKLFQVKERQLNKGAVFNYLYCSKCGTLQLNDEVTDMGKYYPQNYYSFNLGLSFKGKLRLAIIRFLYAVSLFNVADSLIDLKGLKVNHDSKILDVGGGNGSWLYRLSLLGYKDLTCIDLFCEECPYPNIQFKQCDIGKIQNKKYDVITFNSSFEHMQNPQEILKKVKEVLEIRGGVCRIGIPVCESEAWRIYKENWYQIDAPRHYFLYTERAMKKLCENAGLELYNVIYSSSNSQFSISKLYRDTDMSFNEILSKLSRREKKTNKLCKKLDSEKKGDHAYFFIRHKK